MSLTDAERRCLRRIERQLLREDPRLARRLRAFDVVSRTAVPAQAPRPPCRSPRVATSRWFVPVAFAISALLALLGVLSRPAPSSAAACGTVRVPATATRSAGCRHSTCALTVCPR